MANTGTNPRTLARGAIGLRGVLFQSVTSMAYLYARHRERLPEMKQVFDDEAMPAAEPVASGETA